MGALTFEGLIDVAAEVVDPVGVIEFWDSPSGHSILCDINWRVFVFLFQPVQDPPEAKRGHLQPEGAGVWPRAVCNGGNSPASSQGKDEVLFISPWGWSSLWHLTFRGSCSQRASHT